MKANFLTEHQSFQFSGEHCAPSLAAIACKIEHALCQVTHEVNNYLHDYCAPPCESHVVCDVHSLLSALKDCLNFHDDNCHQEMTV